jgi:hypothetical protein
MMPTEHRKSALGRYCCKSPKSDDTENFAKIDFRLLCRRNALWRRYEGPWSILGETMWSLTSPHTKRISGPKNFRSSAEKDFFNTIGHKRTWWQL